MVYKYEINKGIQNLKTRTAAVISGVVLLGGGAGLSLLMLGSAHAAAVSCTPTGFIRDGINMTAAMVNPTTTVSGDVDATGCNVGVYFGPGTKGKVDGATIHGANYYGVVVQKAQVDVRNSNVNHIGETPLNGSQHGVGIYYATIAGLANGDCSAGTTKGEVQNNSVSAYQKGGIVVACTGSKVEVQDNIVEGQGPVNYIAQNGIQFGYGASGEIEGNIVTGNSYTGPNFASSGGILVVGGPYYGGDYTKDLNIKDNVLVQNDVGVYLVNLDDQGNPASTKTKINLEENKIANASLNNKTGNSSTQGYQAGVADSGNKDKIVDNKISGAGYNPASSSTSIFTTWIDTSLTIDAKVHGNQLR